MAILTLTSADAGTTIPVSGSATWTVNGTDAADLFQVAAGTAATVIGGAGVDVVTLLGGSADYTVKLSSTSAVFTHTATGKAVSIPVTSGGDSVAFGNGTAVTLKSTGSVVTLGTQTITATDAAVTGATGSATGGTTGGTTAAQTFTLTSAIDNVAGGSGDDIILGDFTATASINAADQINGGAGTDTFKVYGFTGTQVLPTSLSNVEVLNFVAATAASVDTAAIAGVTSVVLENLTTTAKTAKIGSTASLTLSNNTKANITGAITVDNGTAAAATLVLSKFNDNGSGIDFNGTTNLVKTLTVQSTGGANVATIANTGAAITKLVVTGDTALNASAAALANGIVTVDASAQTAGGVNVLLGTGNTTDTGGAGNDRFAFAATKFDANDKVVGGAGTDTLAVADTSLSAAMTTAVNAVTTMETLEFTGAGATVDAATVTSMTNYNFSGAGAVALTNALSTTGVTVSVDNNASTFALANKIGETVANLTLSGVAAGTGAQTGAATITGVSTLNVVSSKGASTVDVTNQINTFAANPDNMVVVITGDQALTMGAPAASTTGVTINGSAATGVLTLTGTTKADIIKGGSAKDVFNASTGADAITGGAGADTFKFTTDTTVTASTFHTITDYQTGVDKLVLKDVGTEVITTTKLDVSASTTLAGAIDIAMAGAGNVDGIVKWFQFGGDTYIAEDLGAGAAYTVATDIVVKLTGLVDLSNTVDLSITGNLSFA